MATPRAGGHSVQSRSHHNEGEMLSRRGDPNQAGSKSRDSDLEEHIKLKLNPGANVNATSVNQRNTAARKSSCKEIQKEPSFREIESGTLLYSAWFDDRKSQRYIRVLVLTSTRDPLPSLICHFEISASKQKRIPSRVSYYQHSGNHFMQFGCFIASCPLPSELDRIPCFVNISTRSHNKSSYTVVLPVGFISHEHNVEKVSRGQYGICIPPLHGEISVDKLIEFLELSQILGASHFTFYNLDMSDEVQKVLNYYEDKGLACVLTWNLPSYIGKYDIHYFGQTLSIMDCLFRSMSHLDFVAFNDLDEFIVPLQHENITSFLEQNHKGEHCGHCFDSVTFDPSREDLQISRFMTQRIFHRTKKPTPFWNKCIIDPRKIFEQGIHRIIMPIEDSYIINIVDWSIARVFHYRNCDDTHALMHCSGGFKEDKTMQKFGARLKHNFHIINRLLTTANRNKLKKIFM
ncbi:LOW QUALITY PROTEIN: beta-1,4-galactosyltransferase galt-1-like [Oculina patagonica]